MEGSGDSSFKSVMDAQNARVNVVMRYSHTISSAIIRTYISQHLKKQIRLPNNFKPVEISAQTLLDLGKFSYVECLLILAHAKDTAKITTVTTFNVEQVLQGMGYTIAYEAKVGDDLGVTMKVGVDKSVFPMDNEKGYVLFDNHVDKKFYCPIVGNYINTNFFREPRVEKVIFNSQLAEAIALLVTFYSLRNGEITQVVATEAGTQLLNFDKILSLAYVNSLEYVSNIIKGWLQKSQCPDARGWNNITMHSLSFAHTLYSIISRLSSTSDDVLVELATITDIIARVPGGKFFEVRGDNLTIRGCGFGLPKVLNGQSLDVKNKHASIDQAYCALMLSRSMRGTDKREVAGMSRKAYIEFTISPSSAEIIYTATNLRRFVKEDTIIFRADAGKSVGTLIQYLNALIVLDYKGTVIIPNTSAVKNVLLIVPDDKLKEPVYRYLSGEFRVILSVVDTLVLQTSWMRDETKGYKGYVPKKAIIIDLRLLSTTSYDRRKHTVVDLEYESACEARCHEYSMLEYPVIFRCPTFRNMFISDKFDNVTFYTGVELHNLIQWGVYGFKLEDEGWWYKCDEKSLEEICAASILVNIGRCVQAMIRVSPRVLLAKHGFRAPKLLISGIKRILPAQIAYTQEEVFAAVSQGSASIMKMIEESSMINQAQLLSIPLVQQALVENVPDVGASAGKRVIGVEEDEVELDAANVRLEDD